MNEKNTSSILLEAVPVAKIMMIWAVVAGLPLAYHVLIDSENVIGLAALYVSVFIIVLGGANVLLYVIGRGVSLSRQNQI